MEKTKPKILLVEDNELGRKEMGILIGQDFGYDVSTPNSVKEVREAITFQVFDSLLVDVDLSNFDDIGDNIESKIIDDGTDIADFYSDLHLITSGRLYSSHVKLPGSPFDIKIRQLKRKIKRSPFPFTALPKPLPRDMSQIQDLFKPILEEAENVYKSNPLYQPLSYYEQDRRLSKRLRAYKKVCQLHSNWLNFNFQSVGDCSWGMICGGMADKRYYGKPLNGDGDRLDQFKIESRNTYPSKDELNRVARDKNAFPFVVWNTRKIEFLEKQFQQAGQRLVNIPDYLRDFFGMSVSYSCVKAYEEGMKEQVIDWCNQLTAPAQIEIIRGIYKKIYRTPLMEEFIALCRAAYLPLIVEVYNARVDGIEHEGEPVAWVELRHLGDYRAVSMEPFDLRQLVNNEIDHESQRFEFTVYQLSNDDIATSIEPLEIFDSE